MDRAPADVSFARSPTWAWVVVACAGAVAIILMAQAATVSSATYDETAYLRIASDWWRRGVSSEMTRMGSPATFFKLQAAPAFFVLDRIGYGGLIDRPVADQATLLPIVRMAGLWIWAVAFGLTVLWSRCLYGPRAMAFAACLFALGPNLLAHGSLMTMEMPLVAATVGLFVSFWIFLQARPARGGWFLASAMAAGLSFSCKFTTVVYLPILALIWAVDRWREGDRPWRILRVVVPGMAAFAAVLGVTDWALTGFAMLPPSPRTGDHPSAPGLAWLLEVPIPQDWVGFLTQLRHQRNGGPSYLLGERRMTGWWYYYPVALAVKVPLGFWALVIGRLLLSLTSHPKPSPLVGEGRVRGAWCQPRPVDPPPQPSPTMGEGEDFARGRRRDWLFPLVIAAFLAIAMIGSKRNYGVRYLLPMAPLAIVWISALAGRGGGWRWVVGLGMIGQAAAVATIHPHELSYFNVLAGGKIGGRRVLADSNLDWGQGLRSLAAMEKRYRPLTVFSFGEIEPSFYGVESESFLFTAQGPRPESQLSRMVMLGRGYDRAPIGSLPAELPPSLRVETPYVAVSASLQHGPWGPEGYFRPLDSLEPVAYTDDGTIAIYDLGANRPSP